MSDKEAAPIVAAPGAEAREDRFRLAVLAASGPLVLLLAPVLLPYEEDRSLLAEARHTEERAVLALIFVWPLFVGALGLWRALGRRAPGKAAFAVPAVAYGLAAAGLVVLLGAVLLDRLHARADAIVWVGLVAALALIILVVRGFRRAGWERWAHLAAVVWLFHALLATLTELGSRAPDAPALGGWLYLFALGVAAPPLAWALGPRRRA